jgi:hypothetical protein
LTVADCCSSTGTFKQVLCNSSVVARNIPMQESVRRTFDEKDRCKRPFQPVQTSTPHRCSQMPRKCPSVAVQADETGLCRALRPYSSIHPVASVSDRKNKTMATTTRFLSTCRRKHVIETLHWGGKVTALRSTATVHDSECSLAHSLGTKPLKQRLDATPLFGLCAKPRS